MCRGHVTIHYSHVTYLIVYKALNGIVVTDVYTVKENGVIYVCPHIVITCHVMVKPLSFSLKLMAW